MKKIYLNLTGGLGNQIFQLLYCVSYFDLNKYNVQIIINTFYLDKYPTKRSFELAPLLKLINIDFRIEQKATILRLPKIISKLFKSDISLRVGDCIYVDSYHQNFKFYSVPQRERLKIILCSIRHQLNVGTYDKLCLHFRLTDFKQDKSSGELENEKTYIKSILKRKKITVITDDKNDFNSIFGSQLNTDVIFNHDKLSAWELLLEFAKYSAIVSNGSTLSFFGALFGNCIDYKSKLKFLETNFNLMRTNLI